jgi:hypothetical protein
MGKSPLFLRHKRRPEASLKLKFVQGKTFQAIEVFKRASDIGNGE